MVAIAMAALLATACSDRPEDEVDEGLSWDQGSWDTGSWK
jgi:hypothetical protein